MRHFATLMFGLATLWAATGHATSVTTFAPQGDVTEVRQVRAIFSGPMVPLGNPDAAPPFAVSCAESGTGRWADDRSWTYEFARNVPPGTTCRFALKAGFKDLSGKGVTGPASYSFSTGGPKVVRVQPWEGSEGIDEEQVFALLFNGEFNADSVRINSWCESEHVGERIPVKVTEGADRAALLKNLRMEDVAARTILLGCQRRIPNGAKMSVVLGRGIAARSGIATTREQRFNYTVRKPFEANFTCERENAAAPCMPIRPLVIEFSAPVARAVAAPIRLETARGSVAPNWSKERVDATVQRVEFAPPFPESSEVTITLPRDVRDDGGRPLANAGAFPLKIRIGAAPPLAKFPGKFGIVEAAADAMLPVTVRSLESGAAGLPLATVRVDADAEVIGWLKKLNGRGFDFEQPDGCAPAETEDAKARGRRPRPPADCRQAREVSLVLADPQAEKRTLPAPAASRELEVIGIPFPKPGFYAVEVESPALGAALLGAPRPMYVRTAVLVTRLAVHFKRGRDNAVAWVTRLDTGTPVGGAEVRVWDCQARALWNGQTDGDGVARIPQALSPRGSCQSGGREDWAEPALYVSARRDGEFAFVLSNWANGIERWRFGVRTADFGDASLRAHTVFDRTLFRGGETVAMKHFIRRETQSGLAAADALPDRVRIRHFGSGDEVERPIAWRDGAAETLFVIPRTARLGEYTVILDSAAQPGKGAARDGREHAAPAIPEIQTGSFRVSEFRLPLLQGRLSAPAKPQVAAREVPYEIQLNYVNGGPAAGQDLRISSVLRPRELNFPGYEQFRFVVAERASDGEEEPRETLVADRIATKLDRNGAGRVVIGNLPAHAGARLLRTEASFLDPNGEYQTLSTSTPLWPADVLVGIRTDSWVSVGRKTTATLVAVDTTGKPVAGAALAVSGEARTTISHRRRLVGGFYAYEHSTERKALGELCSGKTDARGLLSCELQIEQPGNVVLLAEAKDARGNLAHADASVWITDKGEVWFESESMDRMDVVPEQHRYEPGETARLQLRMPFRSATVLVSVEREGVIETFVRAVNGRNPTIEVPIKAGYGPNVYVSALAVRGRLREVPWYSAFVWGWRNPGEWWRAWREWREKGTPGALVDLGKPAFKYGLAELQVGVGSQELKVTVTPERDAYRVRDRAKVRIRVRMPDGKAVPAGSDVAFAAVDQALLELQPNRSWNLLDAMYQRRAYGVDTATAQMEVIGKRHFGRKAVPAGGGGGPSPGRELFDTLLLWNPRVMLDANGEATVEVPLNDSLTRFALAAVADSGAGHFGTGIGSLQVTQELQIISGLPPLVRGGDAYRAAVTLRNTTDRAMRVRVEARSGALRLEPRTIELTAGAASEAAWDVSVPDDGAGAMAPNVPIEWEFAAREEPSSPAGAAARDTLRLAQKRVPLVPVAVVQSSLTRLVPSVTVPVAPPPGALPGRGGLRVSYAARLGAMPPAVREYFENYPLLCLEQKISRAVGLRDRDLWRAAIEQMPAYLDADGLARYFIGDGPGSDTLTAYILAVSQESGFEIPAALAGRMLAGLAAFVDDRIQRKTWAPRADLAVRKLAGLEALSRYGRATQRQFDALALDPGTLPTGALIDWAAILQRLPSASQANLRQRLDDVLRARLDFTGTRLSFANEASDHWWWLMTSGDSNAARLVLLVLDAPGWRGDVPRLVNGLVGRQTRGRWSTTTANVWGRLALEKFSTAFEAVNVAGISTVSIGPAAGTAQRFDWNALPGGGAVSLPWPAAGARAELRLQHAGAGQPWVTLQGLAAVPATTPQSAGFRVTRTTVPVEQRQAGQVSRGDIVRVKIEVESRADMTWVIVQDPIPAGATILESQSARDSAIATRGEKQAGVAIAAFKERGQETFRAYYEYVPQGKWSVEYTLRLSCAGRFGLPPTRVEAMYAPEMFGEQPNATMTVMP
jgi:alpha-2-macroglobulin